MVEKQGFLASLYGKLATLEAEREKVLTAIKAIEALDAEPIPAKSLAPLPPLPQKRHTAQPLPLIDFTGMTVRLAALKFLEATKPEPQKTGHIATALKNGGMTSDAKSFGTQVYNSLYGMTQNNGPVIKTADGRWTVRQVGG